MCIAAPHKPFSLVPFIISAALPWTHSSLSYFSYDSYHTQLSWWGCTKAEWSGINASLEWLVTLCLMQSRLALLGNRTHYWLILSFPPRKPTRLFLSAGLHSSLFSPSPLMHLGLHSPRCRIWHLSWLNITQLMIAQPCKLSRFPVRPIYPPENQ